MIVTMSPMILLMIARESATAGSVWNILLKSTVIVTSDVPMPPTVIGMSVTMVAMLLMKMNLKNGMSRLSATPMKYICA